jgi:hypothetical protein
VRAILQQIRRELFRKDLTVGRLRQELGLSANDTTMRFRRHTGAPIRRYVEDRRRPGRRGAAGGGGKRRMGTGPARRLRFLIR